MALIVMAKDVKPKGTYDSWLPGPYLKSPIMPHSYVCRWQLREPPLLGVGV